MRYIKHLGKLRWMAHRNLIASAEEVRTFFVRRPWLHGTDRILSTEEYQRLKDRDLRWWRELARERKVWLSGFVVGWLACRKGL